MEQGNGDEKFTVEINGAELRGGGAVRVERGRAVDRPWAANRWAYTEGGGDLISHAFQFALPFFVQPISVYETRIQVAQNLFDVLQIK